MKSEPLILERTYNAPVTRVWSALTNIDQIRKWYFNLAEFKAEVGFEFEFEGGKDDDIYLHKCRITEAVPGKKLQYTWRYEGYEGNSYVTFELFAEGDQTRVKLTHEGLESFPQSDPNFARNSFLQGWTHIVGTSLKAYVEAAV